MITDSALMVQAGTDSALMVQVYAPTFPGYGRSEKPALPYGQTLWREFLRDFVVDVVRRPVIVVGNSIGGYISASLAADNRALVKGVHLVLLHMRRLYALWGVCLYTRVFGCARMCGRARI
jgi:pimeloyl-ACP methyl ester carboxylesterase